MCCAICLQFLLVGRSISNSVECGFCCVAISGSVLPMKVVVHHTRGGACDNRRRKVMLRMMRNCMRMGRGRCVGHVVVIVNCLLHFVSSREQLFHLHLVMLADKSPINNNYGDYAVSSG